MSNTNMMAHHNIISEKNMMTNPSIMDQKNIILSTNMISNPNLMPEKSIMSNPNIIDEKNMMTNPNVMNDKNIIPSTNMMSSSSIMAEKIIMSTLSPTNEKNLIPNTNIMNDKNIISSPNIMTDPNLMEKSVMTSTNLMTEKDLSNPNLMTEKTVMTNPNTTSEKYLTPNPIVTGGKRSISETSDDITELDKGPTQSKRKQYERKVPSKLFHDARYSSWLGISKHNPSKAFCKICSHELSGSVTQIERHKNTSKHIQRMNKQATRAADFVQQNVSSSSTQLTEVASGELELWSFIAEHNLPIALLDHLPGLISNVCKDSKIAKDLKSARSKVTPVTKPVVAPTYWNEIVFQLKNKGLILGVYEDESKEKPFLLTKASELFDERCQGRLSEKLKLFGKSFKKGKSHLLFGLDEEYPLVSIVNVGKKNQGFNEYEERDEGRENVRTAIAKGTLQLRDADQTVVLVDPCDNAIASAEGCHLIAHKYDELKPADKRKPSMELSCYVEHLDAQERTQIEADWQLGTIYSESQNFARLLMEMPANLCTPTRFTELVNEKLSGLCQVTIRDQSWAESLKMGAFLSVSRGSEEPLRFLELRYDGKDASLPPVALVGKGVTFDAGGISLKPSSDMDKMRADMGGAACVVGTFLGVTKLQLPINLRAYIPLTENMPSGTATKPGDVVTAMNGKTIQVDNTDAEGRLILADALCYASSFNPQFILDMATLTGAMGVALGSAAAGTFTNSTDLWNLLHKAGGVTGDRLWRMPLFQHYTSHVTHSQLAALNNIGKYSRAGGSCTAAAFLKEFVGDNQWVHIDIAGVMMNKDEVPYLGGGMAGRPTRTIIEFLKLFSAQEIDQS